MADRADQYEDTPRRRRTDDLTVNEYRLLSAEQRLDRHDAKLDAMATDVSELKSDVKNIPTLIAAEIAKSSDTTIKWIVGTSVSVGVLVIGVIEALKVLHP